MAMNEENKKLEENIKRHIDVMLEKMRSDFEIFGEGLSDVSKKVDLLAEDMDYVKSEIVEIKDRFRETDKMLDKKAEKGVADNHEIRIVKLENAVLAEA